MDIVCGGHVLKLTGRFSGLGNWADGYSVVVAGFNDKSEYAVITKSLPLNQPDGTEVVMTFGGINDEVTALKLCVINRLRECVAVFKRCFLSNAANQADILQAFMAENSDCALSIVE